MADDDPRSPSRRRLLLTTLASVTATAAGTVGYLEWKDGRFAPPPPPPATDRPPFASPTGLLTQRRRLGRTNLQVSVIGIGTGSIESPALIARAVDKGLNYLDTAVCYGGSEDVIGRALRETPGLRDKLVIATKWDPSATAPRERMLESLDKSLRRLGTDHVDVMQIHWLGGGHVSGDEGATRLENPALYEAMDAARRAGKVRFFGATSHHADRSRILRHAIDKKAFDVLLVKMNVLDHETADLPALLAHARQHDVGVVAMKSQPGGGVAPPGFEQSKLSILQANLRWVLEHPEVACVVLSGVGTDPAVQDQAIGAVHEPFSARDAELLDRYAVAMSPHYCRDCAPGCHDACPTGVAIGELLRYRMYDVQYGWRDRAQQLHDALPPARRATEACLGCDLCTSACPWGVDAADRVRDAHLRFGPKA